MYNNYSETPYGVMEPRTAYSNYFEVVIKQPKITKNIKSDYFWNNPIFVIVPAIVPCQKE